MISKCWIQDLILSLQNRVRGVGKMVDYRCNSSVEDRCGLCWLVFRVGFSFGT